MFAIGPDRRASTRPGREEHAAARPRLPGASTLLALLCALALACLPGEARGGGAGDGGPQTPVSSESSEDREAAERLVKRLLARPKLVEGHRVLGMVAVTSMFAAQGFGIGNHIALDRGVSREALAPTLNVHRALALTAVSTWFGAGVVAWSMPGPDGTPASKRLSPAMGRGRRAHIALSIAHGVAMAATVSLGLVSSFATRDTPHWTGTLVAHHSAAATTTTLLLLALGLRTAF